MAKEVASIKKNQQHQLSKLQQRCEADGELLSSIRSFLKDKAKLDEDYGKSLEKLAKTHLTKHMKKAAAGGIIVRSNSGTVKKTDVPSRESMDESQRVVHNAFITVLLETEKVGRTTVDSAEKMVSDISENLKDLQKEKTVVVKKSIDSTSKYLVELHTSYDELEKLRVSYEKSAKEAESAKKKYEETSKKPNSGLNALKNMMTRMDGDERVEKLRVKWKNAARKLAEIRNEYLLMLDAVNAIQDRFYQKDVPDIIKQLDGPYYEELQKAILSFADLQESVAKSVVEEVAASKECAAKIVRETDVTAFLTEHATLFTEFKSFSFEPCANDEIDQVEVDDVSTVVLGQKLQRFISQREDIKSTLQRKYKELSGVKQLTETYKVNPSFGNPNSNMEQMADLQNAIRILEISNTRLDSQISLLEKAQIKPVKPTSGAPQISRPISTASALSASGGQQYIAAYDYEAKGSNEVTIREGDEVTAQEAESGGWIQVKVNRTKEEGLVPFDYLKAKSSSGSVRASMIASGGPGGSSIKEVTAMYDYKASDASELAFSAGDVIEVVEAGEASEDAWWEGRNRRTGKTGSFPLVFTGGWDTAVAAPTAIATTLAAAAAAISLPASQPDSRRVSVLPVGSGLKSQSNSVKSGLNLAGSSRASVIRVGRGKEKVRAIYNYAATCEGELSLTVGDIVTVTNKETGSSAWWEGEGPRGKIGQFPVNHVEVIAEDTDSVHSGSGPSLPARPSVASSLTPGSFSVKALYDYKATADGELTFKTGDFMKVIESSDADWWTAVFRGKEGLVPAAYVERV
ncbi:F-BAR and double SH3 domains protein 1 [Blyttiomyces sp. JEL0837]|nr:F-BAR and double SH3 domains protein 1 [Blyttiomyces sp. JEL0837]